MIVVASSALVAVAEHEDDVDELLATIIVQPAALSRINYVEAGVVLVSRRRMTVRAEYDGWLSRLGITVRDDAGLHADALDCYLRYGKGFHPAQLNLADCFSYALAKSLAVPLLYKGADFSLTDIRAAYRAV